MPNNPAMPIYSLPGFSSRLAFSATWVGRGLCFFGRMPAAAPGGDQFRQAVLCIYVASCVVLFATSGVYHMMAAKTPAQCRDGAAGSPRHLCAHSWNIARLHGILFRGWGRWVPLVLIWMAAFAGIALKTIFRANGRLARTESVSIPRMGGSTIGRSIASQCGFRFVTPLLWGGIAYSVGAIFEYFRWPVLVPGVVQPHELFHIAVLIGALFHFSFIWRIAALPHTDPMRGRRTIWQARQARRTRR